LENSTYITTEDPFENKRPSFGRDVPSSSVDGGGQKEFSYSKRLGEK